MQARIHEGRAFRILAVIGKHTRECLTIEVDRHIRSRDVLHVLTDLFTWHWPPHCIRSDNGCQLIAQAVRDWLARAGVKTLNWASMGPVVIPEGARPRLAA